jgi:glycosyltransferase involved in cell wall biosynthesis
VTEAEPGVQRGPARDRKRAVVLVGSPAAPYSRALRVARTLVELGYSVEIAAVFAPGLPTEERVDEAIVLRRYRPTGWLASVAAQHRGHPGVARTDRLARQAAIDEADTPRPPPVDRLQRAARPFARLARRPLGLGRTVVRRAIASVLWPHTVRAWWHTLARELPAAALYHATGSLTIAAALHERRSKADRRATVIYDAIDDVFRGNHVLEMPGLARRWNARRERGWALESDAVITVNEVLARKLRRRWRISDPVEVVGNYPEAPAWATGRPDRIRAELGLPPTTRIVLFQGRLSPRLGLDEAAEAVLLVPDAVLVLIGFGRWLDRSRARDAEPRFRGRHFTLDARHPDELAQWTASADVSVVPLPPVSENQRLSTPNKFWESLIAGTPVVVPRQLEVMATLTEAHGLGMVVSSNSPIDMATGIRAVLDRPQAERDAERERIATVARETFSWPAAAAVYRGVVERAIANRVRHAGGR